MEVTFVPTHSFKETPTETNTEKIRKKITYFHDFLHQSITRPNTTMFGRFFSAFFALNIIVATIIFVLQTLPHFYRRDIRLFTAIEAYFAVVFTFELFIRFFAARYPMFFFYNYMVFFDLFAIIPSYIELIFPNVDLNFLMFRVVRLAQLSKFFFLYPKFNAGFRLITDVLKASSQVLLSSFIFIGVAVLLISTAVFYCERGTLDDKSLTWFVCDASNQCSASSFQSIVDAIFFSIVTASTVGYGDQVPKTLCGKCFATILMVIGLVLVAMPVSVITSNFTLAVQEDEDRRERLLKMKKAKGRIQCKVRIGFERILFFMSETAIIFDLITEVSKRIGKTVDKIICGDTDPVPVMHFISMYSEKMVAEFDVQIDLTSLSLDSKETNEMEKNTNETTVTTQPQSTTVPLLDTELATVQKDEEDTAQQMIAKEHPLQETQLQASSINSS